MNGRAWVVEERNGPRGGWWAFKICGTRAIARSCAAAHRKVGYVVRVRQYIRQPEIRP